MNVLAIKVLWALSSTSFRVFFIKSGESNRKGLKKPMLPEGVASVSCLFRNYGNNHLYFHFGCQEDESKKFRTAVY